MLNHLILRIVVLMSQQLMKKNFPFLKVHIKTSWKCISFFVKFNFWMLLYCVDAIWQVKIQVRITSLLCFCSNRASESWLVQQIVFFVLSITSQRIKNKVVFQKSDYCIGANMWVLLHQLKTKKPKPKHYSLPFSSVLSFK